MSLLQASVAPVDPIVGTPTPGAIAAWIAASLLAITVPTLIAYNMPPSATLFNQVAAFFGWGLLVLLLALSLRPRFWPRSRAGLALVAAMLIIGVAALASPLWAATPWALSLSVAGTVLAAILVVLCGAAAVRGGLGDTAFKAFCIALAIAGVASAAIGLIQVFAPQWSVGYWVAPGPMNGRAIGNLRQSNHLSSLLLWSSIAIVWLGEARVLPKSVSLTGLLLFTFIVFLTGSRTGMTGTFVLAFWGLLDRRMSSRTLIALMLTPFVFALMWHAESWWSAAGHAGFGAADRAHAGDMSTSSRFSVWSNAWSLIQSHPWRGVGFGEFNFAWSLTPFPNRPNEFFDHTHDIVVNFAVELGLPTALLVSGLLLFALVSALVNALRDGRKGADDAALRTPGTPPMQRAAFMVVAMIALHSLFEYPLWYAYFLLPTAFAFGLCVERPSALDHASTANRAADGTRPLLLCAMVLTVASVWVLFDYLNMAAIFSSADGRYSLDTRIQRGQQSLLFAHHADYAAATVTDHPSSAMSAFGRAPHFLLDARLMVAWAQALNEIGEVERARYVAQRAREFRNAEVARFFAPCAAPARSPAQPLPFQCIAPTRSFTYEDFK